MPYKRVYCISRENGEACYGVGEIIVKGRNAAQQAYTRQLRAVLDEFFPATVVHNLLQTQNLGVVEDADIFYMSGRP